MSEEAEKVIAAALQLSEAERLAVAAAMLDSIPRPMGALSEGDPDFDKVLDQRLADYEAGITQPIPGDEFLRRLYGQRG